MPAHFDITMFYSETVERAREPLAKSHDLCIDQYNRLHDGVPVKHLDILQSTFKDNSLHGLDIRSKQNGFVHTVTQAYNDHHHLVIRPDDVWIAITSQFSIYINKHAESFREKFVSHQGKEKLVVTMRSNRDTENFGFLCREMSALVQRNILDKDLREWMIPNFTTTTENDVVICSVMMMATMKSYFEYEMSKCGIPEVTLEGERSDWVEIRNRIERLSQYGEEPTQWLRLLRPVLDRFIGLFDGEGDVDFWNKVSVNYALGSGLRFLSGWITAFCVWDNDGNWQGVPQTEPYTVFGVQHQHQNREIDGVIYPTVPTEKVPMGFCQVDVRVIDGFGETDCIMLAGHMSTLVEGEREDTVRPYPTWFMFADPEKKHELPDPPLASSVSPPEMGKNSRAPAVVPQGKSASVPSKHFQGMDQRLQRVLQYMSLRASCGIHSKNDFVLSITTKLQNGQSIIQLPIVTVQVEGDNRHISKFRALHGNTGSCTSKEKPRVQRYFTLQLTNVAFEILQYP